MTAVKITILAVLLVSGCRDVSPQMEVKACDDAATTRSVMPGTPPVYCGLLTTRFKSYAELLDVVRIEYDTNGKWVRVSQCGIGLEVTSLLSSGVSESDFSAARDGGVIEKLALLIKSPTAVRHRKDLQRVYTLARRRPDMFGDGDPAFYDLSKSVMNHILDEDIVHLDTTDLQSEKGYFNTINHILAQTFMTVLFSEKLADLVADAHERKHMPELITGKFTEEQIADLDEGPVDNYVDMINNEWGQELGKVLKEQYKIDHDTVWTPELLSSLLNNIQRYLSWSFDMGFEPFEPGQEVVRRFASKLNKVMS